MSCPVWELMAGIAPIGRAFSAGVIPVDVRGVAEAGREVVAAVTLTATAAAGGVQTAFVVALAVAVSLTDVTEEAPDATGTCASTETAFVSVTEPTAHFAVPSPVPQPPVNVGVRLDGCVPSAMNTPAAVPFLVETWTVKEAF
jgi:Flp pilus assembly protein TadG